MPRWGSRRKGAYQIGSPSRFRELSESTQIMHARIVIAGRGFPYADLLMCGSYPLVNSRPVLRDVWNILGVFFFRPGTAVD